MRVTSFPTTSVVLWVCLLCQTVMGQAIGRGQQLVVLQNGQLLRGQITETTANTIVQTANGSRLVLSNDRVDFVCDSMQDAYWGKCAQIKASDVAGQKSLFYWCLKHGLHAQAQNQILLLTESNQASASEIESLDRQLNVSISQLAKRKSEKRNKQQAQLARQTPPRQNSPQAPIATALADFPSTGFLADQRQPNNIASRRPVGTGLVENGIDYNVFRPLPALNVAPSPQGIGSSLASSVREPVTGQGMVRQVGFEEEIESNQPEPQFKTISLDHKLSNPVKPQPALIQATPPSTAELDRMTRSMPKRTLGPYRSKLERVFINGCSAAKCHDSHSNVMPLMDLGRSKPIPRRMSQRNLHETLKFIDRSNPFASPLLAAASEPHGGGEKPVLPVGSKHFEQLKLWVIMLSDDPEANYQAYLNPALQKKPVDPIDEVIDQHDIVPIKPERIGLRPLDPMVEHSQTIGEIPELDNQVDSYQPKDPFDPEVFNRRYGQR